MQPATKQSTLDRAQQLMDRCAATAERIASHPEHDVRTRDALHAFNLSTAALGRLTATLRGFRRDFPKLYGELIELE